MACVRYIIVNSLHKGDKKDDEEDDDDNNNNNTRAEIRLSVFDYINDWQPKEHPSISERGTNSTLAQSARTGPESHVASCSVGTGFYSEGDKKPRRKFKPLAAIYR